MFRRKSLDTLTQHESGHRLVRSLSWLHLIALGVGAIVGTGIFTLIGVGAERAGPGVLLSFAVAGLVCICAALAYAEMATMMPAAGGAYTYSYVALGEIVAWVVGWCLILEYSLIVSTVAVGWSGYMVGFLTGMGIHLPHAIIAGPQAGGIVNLPAVLITFLIAGLLIRGTKESATFNAVLVLVKLAALALFVFIAAQHFDVSKIQPFMPYGFFKSTGADGVERGVMAAAAIVFFAYAGFDAVATAAEEAKNPDRDLAIGIVGSLLGCTVIYIFVSLAALGAMSYLALGNSAEPLALILRTIGQDKMAVVIAGAAVIALPTVLLAFLYGQSRIFFVMARDGLLPKRLAAVNQKTGTPITITLLTTLLVATLAGVARLDEIAALANSGTLMAFVAVGASLLVMRWREPGRVRKFRAPAGWLVGLGAIGGCLYLFLSLPSKTLMWFFCWSVLGLAVYFVYGRKKSLLKPS